MSEPTLNQSGYIIYKLRCESRQEAELLKEKINKLYESEENYLAFEKEVKLKDSLSALIKDLRKEDKMINETISELASYHKYNAKYDRNKSFYNEQKSILNRHLKKLDAIYNNDKSEFYNSCKVEVDLSVNDNSVVIKYEIDIEVPYSPYNPGSMYEPPTDAMIEGDIYEESDFDYLIYDMLAYLSDKCDFSNVELSTIENNLDKEEDMINKLIEYDDNDAYDCYRERFLDDRE